MTGTPSHDDVYRGMFPEHEPVFVLGAARSGTSIVCDGLRFGAGIPGCREGYVYSTAYLVMTHLEARWQEIGPGLEHLAGVDAEDADYKRALSRFDVDDLLRHVLRFFHDLSVEGDARMWVDKTPDLYMVHATPILCRAYPRARFVFVRRNGLDVLDSRRRTHPEMSFEEGCADWVSVMTDWSRARALVEGRYLEVDQRDVALRGAEESRRLGEFLELDAGQVQGMTDHFSRERPGRTSKRSYSEELRLDSVDWKDEERTAFERMCLPTMELYGYSW